MVNCNAVLKFKFNVGEIVKVVDIGYTYASYIDWFKENNYKDLFKRFIIYDTPTENKQYKIIAKGLHRNTGEPLCVIEDLNTNQVYLIGESGLESVNKETRLHDLFTDVLEYTLLNRNFPQPPSPYGYSNSFDFIKGKINLVVVNHKKKQVIIRWNDGTKTKATCNEKDDFDIKVGFAIAFTRKFFKNDKKLERYITLKRPKNNLIIKEKSE